MLTIHVEIDLNRRRMYVEPSFTIIEDASYDEDVRLANLNVKYAKGRLEASPMDERCVERLKQALADRQRIGRNKRYDPKRKLKAQAQLSQLEAEIRRLRPTFRKHVRLELRKLI